MMNERRRFDRELWDFYPDSYIPMKDYCVKKAERHVLKERSELSVLFDREVLEGLIEDYLFKFWRRHASLKPNHRWNCIEADLNGEWFNKHSGWVKESCSSPEKIR